MFHTITLTPDWNLLSKYLNINDLPENRFEPISLEIEFISEGQGKLLEFELNRILKQYGLKNHEAVIYLALIKAGNYYAVVDREYQLYNLKWRLKQVAILIKGLGKIENIASIQIIPKQGNVLVIDDLVLMESLPQALKGLLIVRVS